MNNTKELNPCPECNGEMKCTYTENEKYKYYCEKCGRKYELDAPSQEVADMIYNGIMTRKGKNEQDT